VVCVGSLAFFAAYWYGKTGGSESGANFNAVLLAARWGDIICHVMLRPSLSLSLQELKNIFNFDYESTI